MSRVIVSQDALVKLLSVLEGTPKYASYVHAVRSTIRATPEPETGGKEATVVEDTVETVQKPVDKAAERAKDALDNLASRQLRLPISKS